MRIFRPVKGVLKHFKYSLTGGRELGELWSEIQGSIVRTTGKEYPINKKKTEVNASIKIFNEAFEELFKPESPEYILNHAQPLLEQQKTYRLHFGSNTIHSGPLPTNAPHLLRKAPRPLHPP